MNQKKQADCFRQPARSRNLTDALRLYAITDRRWLREGESLVSAVESLLEGGVTAVQLREKQGTRQERLEEGRALLALCHQYGVPLIVNDDPELAKELGADGVHLGQEDMEIGAARRFLGNGFILGATAHTVEEARRAYKAGADYLGSGAVFGTFTKEDASRLSPSELSAICAAVPIPVVAIGGVTAENIGSLRGTGIAGAAVISALFAAEDHEQAAKTLLASVSTAIVPPSSSHSGANRAERTGQLPTALSIAGSDPSGGAGLQADLKTMTVHGVYGMTAVTALTVQNTCGVQAVYPVTPEQLREQLDAVFTDIVPDAVKIGMLFSAQLMQVTAERLRFYSARQVVLDPVMVSTSGHRLMCREAEETLVRELFPLAALITPNLPEAETLLGSSVETAADMEEAAAALSRLGGGIPVLLKGGHLKGEADDLLYCKENGALWLKSKRIDNPNTHGTGCTLSSAIASNLALGFPLAEAVQRAKVYLSAALRFGLDLGRGAGPLNHMAGFTF